MVKMKYLLTLIEQKTLLAVNTLEVETCKNPSSVALWKDSGSKGLVQEKDIQNYRFVYRALSKG